MIMCLNKLLLNHADNDAHIGVNELQVFLGHELQYEKPTISRLLLKISTQIVSLWNESFQTIYLLTLHIIYSPKRIKTAIRIKAIAEVEDNHKTTVNS